MNDLGAATQNLLLAVHAAGLGAVWVGYFDQIGLDEIIKRPRELQPLALVPVGHYNRAKSHGKDQRRPASEIFFSEDLEHPLDI